MSDGTDTRDEAYRELVADRKKLTEKQAQVLAIIESYEPISNEQISVLLDWSINRVTGRCKELRDLGLVEDAGVWHEATKRPFHKWKVKR